MQDASQTALPGTSPPIETAADAQAAIVQLTEVMDGLEAVVAQETELVRAGQLRKASALGVQKTELSGLYFKTVERLMPIHEAQILTYLKLSGLHTGLLLNFNSAVSKDGMRRIML